MASSMASESGFVRGSSDNLPKVDMAMVVEIIKEDVCFNASEIRGVKQASASREQYGDAAIGYVQLKRERSMCIVKSQVCPEHRVWGKAYDVTLIIDESKEKVTALQCHGCASSEGGCKHAIALLMWVHRRSEEPSPTEVTSYWVKPRLAGVLSQKEHVTAVELGGSKPSSSEFPDNSSFLNMVLEGSKGLEDQSVLTKNINTSPHLKEEELSIHFICIEFMKRHRDEKVDADIFSKFAENFATHELISSAFSITKGQTNSPLWSELRYGRITASVLHEASRCKKSGTLVKNILGGGSALVTRAVSRGKKLEPLVIKEVEKMLKIKINSCGIQLSQEHPLFGASPDGVTDDFTVEVKCPSKESTKALYVKGGQLTAKVKAQVQLQMFMMGKEKALICIAEPNFELEKGVMLMWENINYALIKTLMSDALKFWEKFVFGKIIESCN